MKLAVHYPHFIFQDQRRNFNGYNVRFIVDHADYVFWPAPVKWAPRLSAALDQQVWHLKKRLKELASNGVGPKVIVTEQELARHADVLVSFNGEAFKDRFTLPKGFSGMKVAHGMDYVFYPEESCVSLQEDQVDWLMGYTRHDKYCAFFQQYYAPFNNRIIPVPFGCGDRFLVHTDRSQAIPKALGIGSVNPVDDPQVEDKRSLETYMSFFKDTTWTHGWRQMLRVSGSGYETVFANCFPKPPHTKDASYDPVELHKQFAFFANDEGLMNFPPARTYEGSAMGCVMVGADNPIYHDLGFVHGENCLLHKQHDLDDFRRVVQEAASDRAWIQRMSESARELMENKYTHRAVAKQLYEDIKEKYVL